MTCSAAPEVTTSLFVLNSFNLTDFEVQGLIVSFIVQNKNAKKKNVSLNSPI